MIPVIELVKSLRYALGDMQGINISDYELIEQINHATGLLYEDFSEHYVYAGIKKRLISVGDENFYMLPSDFVRIHQIVIDGGCTLAPASINPPRKGKYRIVDKTLYADKGTYTFEYYYIPLRVETLEDVVDAPESMRLWIEQISLALFQKDTQRAEYLIKRCENMLAGHEISYFENIGPVQVLGGIL